MIIYIYWESVMKTHHINQATKIFIDVPS